jgi:hypothetical protein
VGADSTVRGPTGPRGELGLSIVGPEVSRDTQGPRASEGSKAFKAFKAFKACKEFQESVASKGPRGLMGSMR